VCENDRQVVVAVLEYLLEPLAHSTFSMRAANADRGELGGDDLAAAACV